MSARGNSAATISRDDHTGPSTAIQWSLKVAVTAATDSAPAGVQNDGYWGIPVRPRTTYAGSFYAKTDSSGVPVTVSLVNDRPASPLPAPRLQDSPASGSSTHLRSRLVTFPSRPTTT